MKIMSEKVGCAGERKPSSFLPRREKEKRKTAERHQNATKQGNRIVNQKNLFGRKERKEGDRGPNESRRTESKRKGET